ncbi:hypothetical protein DSCA_43120 [Desulfosarcina alkanivorans]|uniref:Uncharacterized protein n=1 Tax=Desulfosarcina alkanivorans TaxID=571177 RepID=A0A5K7YKX9_9BACT|nr:hypothetical protein DSCA_43120 [Desulfosarcina alkanivorans]
MAGQPKGAVPGRLPPVKVEHAANGCRWNGALFRSDGKRTCQQACTDNESNG